MSITPFITLSTGQAVPAAQFYTEIFPHSTLSSTVYVQPDGTNSSEPLPNSVATVNLIISNLPFIIMEMDEAQVPQPSWANSYLVSIEDLDTYDTVFSALSSDGTVMMTAEDFNIYQKICWITDKFGITWQLVCLK